MKSKNRFLAVSTIMLAFVTLRAGASTLDSKMSWYGSNKDRLQQFIDQYSPLGNHKAKGAKPVAVFDFDNTVVKNDAGDATLFWMLSHNQIKPPRSWRQTSDFLSDDAVAQLEKNCPGELSAATCLDTILSIYDDGTLLNSKVAAWKKTYDADLMEPSYAWNVQLMAGHTPAQLKKFANHAMVENFKNSLGTKQKIGTKEVTASVKIYDQIKDLIGTLQKSGFDVWIVSASSQYVVEVFAKEVGVPTHHIIGVRPALDSSGKTTTGFLGCGSAATGDKTLISYRKGKRCWVNKVIFHVKNSSNQMEKPSPIVFAAGDSDTDIFFLKDAAGLRLAINRNKPELMCNAYENKDGRWIINPMFLGPKPPKPEGYNCAPFGIPNQKDTIF